MSNLYTDFLATTLARIGAKTQPHSIKKLDVNNPFDELASLALLMPQSNIDFLYPKDWMARDAAFNLFISLADDVSGDTTNASNWQLVSSTGSTQSIFDLAATKSGNAYSSTNGAITSYASNRLHIVTPSAINTETPSATYQINALGALPIKKIGASGTYVDINSGDFSGTSLFLYRAASGGFWLMVPMSFGGSEITDTTARLNMQTAGNWLDAYGNIASFGGTYNGPAIIAREHDYFVDGVYKYEMIKVSGALELKRFQHSFPA